MTLDTNDPKLTAYALGELDEPARREVEAALEGDEAARRAVEEIRSVAGMLTEQLAAEPAPGLTAEQRRAVQVQPAGPVRRIRLWVPLAAAAAAILAVGVGLYLATLRQGGETPVAPRGGTPGPSQDATPAGTPEPKDDLEYYGTPEPAERKTPQRANGSVKLIIKLPPRQFPPGTPEDLRSPNLPKKPPPPRKPLMVPRGTKLVSRDKPVTASDDEPIIGELDQITDGDKEGTDGSFVELGPGLQWVQIDLQGRYEIHAIMVWHCHANPCVFRDVVVQVCDDADFIENVRTVFNNDHDNSSGLGIGKEYEWMETNQGKRIDTKGIKARYVRLYSNGSTSSDQNTYTEVEVFGRPAEAGKTPGDAGTKKAPPKLDKGGTAAPAADSTAEPKRPVAAKTD